ncbi:MAG TPA: ABC-type transport auxiliary lipoprotein family protein [Rhodocyclaceae bacterium]|nr:ABC-type transport auxiliary lipoprotein family protein [Rhodocyclaceae bacterium]
MKVFTIFLVAALLAACGNTRPAVERQSFLIRTERSAPMAVAPVAGVLRVARVVVAPPFDQRALVYRRGDVRYETDFYNQFAADPPDMLAEAVAGWLRQGGLFQRVVAPAGAAPADYRLDTSVSAFYVDFQANPPSAVISLRWHLVRERDGSTLLENDSRQRVALAEKSPDGAVRALRDGLQLALGELEAALAAIRY